MSITIFFIAVFTLHFLKIYNIVQIIQQKNFRPQIREFFFVVFQHSPDVKRLTGYERPLTET